MPDCSSADGFLSTPSARRATRGSRHVRCKEQISIHALREEGDARRLVPSEAKIQFLSTPSARRATKRTVSHWYEHRYFYPRPPRGGRRENDTGPWAQTQISIHALREEGDRQRYWLSCFLRDFYPRPPRGGRHEQAFGYQEAWAISIHALREEGDSTSISVAFAFLHFYPRPPRGGRPHSEALTWSEYDFYPRPPRGGRPDHDKPAMLLKGISIHALREEGDATRSR